MCPALKARTTQHMIPACNAVIFLSFPMVNIHYILIILKKISNYHTIQMTKTGYRLQPLLLGVTCE